MCQAGRSARALSGMLLESFDKQAVILPKIRMLGDVDSQEFGLETGIEEFFFSQNTIQPLERKLELARLIEGWIEAMSQETRRLFDDEDIIIPSSKADAIRLSESLCILLNQVTQEEVPWSNVREVVPEEHNEWWRLTTTFLQIVMEVWPDILAERNLCDPMQKTCPLAGRADPVLS